MRPLVTIAVPTFNRPRLLREALESASAQTYREVEILVSDNGTSAETEEVCRGYTLRDSRVKYWRNRRNLGISGNFNALADAARGEFVAYLGDDDRLLPDFVSRLVGAAGPHAHVVFSNHYLMDEEGRRLVRESAEFTRAYGRHLLPEGEVADAAAAVWRNSVPICSALIRSEDLRRLRFKEDLNTPEVEFFARLAVEGGSFVYLADYLAEYRVHPQSATSAGLRSERLARYLIAMPATAEAEEHKRRFMAPLLVNAVSRCLQQGDRASAREFMRSEYYPRPETRILKDVLRVGAQGLCANLPAAVGRPLYRLVRRVKTGAGL